MVKKLALIMVVGATGTLFPVASAAQTAAIDLEGRPEIITKLFDCRDIADPTDRLACYDREVATVEEAEQSDELLIAGREQVREAKRGLFGFTLPKIKLFSGGDDDDQDEIKEIEIAIASARRGRDGKMLFVMEDGSRWMQTDRTPILASLEQGDILTIKVAALGSYTGKIGSSRAFRLKRLN